MERELAEYISARTSLNRGEIENVLQEPNEAIVFFAKQGLAVKLARAGTFAPAEDLGGTFDAASG